MRLDNYISGLKFVAKDPIRMFPTPPAVGEQRWRSNGRRRRRPDISVRAHGGGDTTAATQRRRHNGGGGGGGGGGGESGGGSALSARESLSARNIAPACETGREWYSLCCALCVCGQTNKHKNVQRRVANGRQLGEGAPARRARTVGRNANGVELFKQ